MENTEKQEKDYKIYHTISNVLFYITLLFNFIITIISTNYPSKTVDSLFFITGALILLALVINVIRCILQRHIKGITLYSLLTILVLFMLFTL
ncbi:hypothetical protein BU067_01610 [Staphylococcus succinus]|nr:hypothetical protein BU067_01610 [Staphylococcus succinus]